MPFYSASASGVAVGVSAQIFAIRPPAGNMCRLREVRLFTRAATLTPIAISRTSPISTAGTAVTAQRFNLADRANTTAFAHTVTAGTLTAGDLWTWGAAAAGAGFIWIPPDDVIIPASGEIVIRNATAVAGSAVDVGVVIEE